MAGLEFLEHVIARLRDICGLYDDELYPDWVRVTREAFADGAKARTECLWLSPRTVEQQTQASLFTVDTEVV